MKYLESEDELQISDTISLKRSAGWSPSPRKGKYFIIIFIILNIKSCAIF